MNPVDWAALSDEQLLERRIRGLQLTLEGSGLERLIKQLRDELSARELTFHPACHLGDEWFVPEGIPVLFIPFYLVHPRLRELEERQMQELEGGTDAWFMKLIRHETAHAYSYAYALYRKRKWQETFGLASTPQSDFYHPRPYSRSYVRHLPDWYAQNHPDEDFAETFAVWLTPGLDWRRQYQGWKALEKLEYVDRLMHSIAGQSPVHDPEYHVSDLDCLNVKLRNYYLRKRRRYEDEFPDFHDPDLRRLFPESASAAGIVSADLYLQRVRPQLMDAVCDWSNQGRHRVTQLLARLIQRCRDLGLYVQPDHAKLPFEIAAFITTLVMNHRFTGKFKRARASSHLHRP
jgi:hypothetical protein